jgi:SAM-dependent methyltransferase
MKGGFFNWLRYSIFGGLIPEGSKGIAVLGHRLYVGGKWDEIGRLQFDFMCTQGLKPEHVFLDIGCGSFRGGIHFIPYLNKGNYLAIEKEEELVQRGIRRELGKELFEQKNPEIVITDAFEFSKLSKVPDYSLSLSLFTHLSSVDISLCMKNLRGFVNPGHLYYATFFEGELNSEKQRSHSLDHFEYTREAMEKFGSDNGWQPDYIGEWNHPRDLVMMLYTAK